MSRHRAERTGSSLDARLEALEEARGLAQGVLPEPRLAEAYQVLDRAASRRSLSAEHTVVGFFGATGSGKSSLFNAVLGHEVARATARRPTTSEPLAAVWQPEGSDALLDWLGVARRHAAEPVDGLADPSTGLILLDLPDFDSTAREHRETVERLVGMVDVMVWVLDPQKYADDALHSGFLRRLGGHGSVTLTVLNQADRLAPAERGPVLESLGALLAGEGLGAGHGARGVITASARTGEGVGEVRAAIRRVVASRRAASERLEADARAAAAALAEASGDGDPVGVTPSARRVLADELATAARVPLVAEAVRRSYRREARRRTGWPLTRWALRLGRDPLQRLGLRRDAPAGQGPYVARTSLPPASAAERARADAAVRQFTDAASEGAPGPWRAAIRAAGRAGRDRLPDELDQAVARTDLGAARRSWWWVPANILQWLALLTALGGVGWLGVLAVLGYLQLPVPEVPRVEGWPLPTLALLGGILAGIVLALALAPVVAFGARRRAARARRHLSGAVAAVAEREVVEPVRAEIARHAAFSAALERARK